VKVFYTEGISKKSGFSAEELSANFQYAELQYASDNHIPTLSYPEGLAEVANAKQCIAVAGSHGKSTTTSMIGVMLAEGKITSSTVVGTILPQFGHSNFHYAPGPFFTIEACEYKRSFLRYTPYISVITNIDLDHLDYYHDLADYMSAFAQFVVQTKGFVMINSFCQNSLQLAIPDEKKILVGDTYFEVPSVAPKNLGGLAGKEGEKGRVRYNFPSLTIQVP